MATTAAAPLRGRGRLAGGRDPVHRRLAGDDGHPPRRPGRLRGRRSRRTRSPRSPAPWPRRRSRSPSRSSGSRRRRSWRRSSRRSGCPPRSTRPGRLQRDHDGRAAATSPHVIHQANIDVDEKGTEAAAATAVVMRATAMPAEPVAVPGGPAVPLRAPRRPDGRGPLPRPRRRPVDRPVGQAAIGPLLLRDEATARAVTKGRQRLRWEGSHQGTEPGPRSLPRTYSAGAGHVASRGAGRRP